MLLVKLFLSVLSTGKARPSFTTKPSRLTPLSWKVELAEATPEIITAVSAIKVVFIFDIQSRRGPGNVSVPVVLLIINPSARLVHVF